MTADTPTLDTMTATTVTRQLIALADAGGLHPHVYGARNRLVEIALDGHGADGLFGVLYVSAKNGNTVRAHLTHGNHGEGRCYGKVAEIRTVLKSWAAIHRDRLAARGPHNHFNCRKGCNPQPLTLIDREQITGRNLTQYDETARRPFCVDCLADLPASAYHAGFHVCGQQTVSDVQAAIERN